MGSTIEGKADHSDSEETSSSTSSSRYASESTTTDWSDRSSGSAEDFGTLNQLLAAVLDGA
ncbi:hypothetical protein GOP47_0025879 [Adiantum capillus-veneris]|uniref:Uncharacterized protein n=1 Tax=Adiantum capillus-veneris TaxID=13818 RepID=A0A9D4Z397_ADICA|nr:hypothetical protein GOP47_0025879 [Adiantum capillus-veneris]